MPVQPIPVVIHASDPLDHTGMTALLRAAPEIEVLAAPDRARARVLVLAEYQWTETHRNALRRIRGPEMRVVIVTERFDEQDILAAAQSGVVCVLPSAQVTQARLVTAVTAAANGSALMSRQLQGALLRQLNALRSGLLEPNGWTVSGLGQRELDVIRLVADGFSIEEIASELSLSEGTVKNCLHTAMKRLGLANRTHAVAYAIRAGALA